MKSLTNKVYSIMYSASHTVYVRTFRIEHEYRGRGYPRRIFNNLKKKYKRRVTLECHPTLFCYYLKLGFNPEGVTYDGYIEMTL